MKKRAGFVSNSSSSSFILDKRYITAAEIAKLEKFIEEDCDDGWNIADSGEDFIRGYTMMDNGSLSHWIEDNIAQPRKAVVSWGEL